LSIGVKNVLGKKKDVVKNEIILCLVHVFRKTDDFRENEINAANAP
jgi:hypothetical protein